jgi:hypothetical protein
MDDIWVVVHEHVHGVDVSAHLTKTGALAAADTLSKDNAEDVRDGKDIIYTRITGLGV